MATERKKYLHANHRSRMRERFAVRGFDGYHSHEVLEQVLFEAIPRVNTNETAHLLINEFGSLENVFRVAANDLEKVHGIGKTSAAYLESRFRMMSEAILAQYKGLADLNIYQIAFLTDWFMRGIDKRNFGLVVCGGEGEFLDFRYVFEPDECDCIPSEMDSDTLSIIAGKIIGIVGEGAYYLVMNEIVIERSDLYKLLDETRREKAVMLNAYKLVGKKPESVIYPN